MKKNPTAAHSIKIFLMLRLLKKAPSPQASEIDRRAKK
jgi:hypothetical protein